MLNDKKQIVSNPSARGECPVRSLVRNIHRSYDDTPNETALLADLAQFLPTVDRSCLSAIVRNVMLSPLPEPDPNHDITSTLNFDRIERGATNAQALGIHLSLLSRPIFWKALIGQLTGDDMSTETQGIAESFSHNNTRFLQLGFVGLGLACALGRQVTQVITQPPAGRMGIFNAVARAGLACGDPVQDAEELLQRLGRMFPTCPRSEKGHHNGFRYLVESGAYESGKRCPYIAYSRTIFFEYGKLLEDPIYQKHLTVTVSL